jgi:hypothetical protein
LTINEAEPYQLDTEYTLHSYKSIALNLRSRQRLSYTTGITVDHISGACIQPRTWQNDLDEPADPQVASEWTRIAESLQPTFTMATAQYFMDTIDQVLQAAPSE